MALDFQNQAGAIQEMEIPELIPTVQLLFERYVKERLGLGEDIPFQNSLTKRYFLLHSNNEYKNNGSTIEVKIGVDTYHAEVKCSIDQLRRLAMGLLSEFDETSKNT